MAWGATVSRLPRRCGVDRAFEFVVSPAKVLESPEYSRDERHMQSGRWAKGYTQAELDDAQQKFGLTFPPDLVDLLRDRRPVDGHVWTDEVAIRRMLDWPFEGLLFDVEHNRLWWPEGEKSRPVWRPARRFCIRSSRARRN